MIDKILIRGAREHNLKNIDVEIPKNKLVVFTGVSGSGKSSLALDTIYAEGQRRYVESLSSYARQFLGVMKKPDVDRIEGLSPAIAIDQKTTSHNPRSTVGTATEIYDFLRLLFARVGHPHCPKCGKEISQQSAQQIVDQILNLTPGKGRGIRLIILAPVIRDRKGEFSALFENLKKQGFSRVRIDREVKDLDEEFVLIKTNRHTIEAVVDRVVIRSSALGGLGGNGGTGGSSRQRRDLEDNKQLPQAPAIRHRLTDSVETGLKLADGNVIVSEVQDSTFQFPEKPKKMVDRLFSEHFACPNCNISLPEIEPRTFSFNSPYGACSFCEGLGSKLKVNSNLVLNPKLSLNEGGILPWSRLISRDTWFSRLVHSVAKDEGIDLNCPLSELPTSHLQLLLYGSDNLYEVSGRNRFGRWRTFDEYFEGVIPNLERRYRETESDFVRGEIEKYMVKEPCPQCQGARLKPEALGITIGGRSIVDVTRVSIKKVALWVEGLSSVLSERESHIAKPIVKELKSRLKFLIAVGLDYLTLNRASGTLAGGEAQRIRLASQIGSGLSGVLYVLDEPSVGLHFRDLGRLIKTLRELRDLGNTVIVVEHDPQTIKSGDWILDFGPGAGEEGGKIVATGTPQQICKTKASLTGEYLSGRKKVIGLRGYPLAGVTPNGGQALTITGCREHNLKNINVSFPLSKFIVITGVSGSGKSTLINETLHRALRVKFGLKQQEKPGKHQDLLGIEHINKVINIDQSPIGKTPRSNPATYTKAFDFIRQIFAQTKEAKLRGYKQGRFSFNVKGGRCEICRGEGQIKIEMQFLPDIYVDCEVCQGKCYNSETLEVLYKGKNIAQVLGMSVSEALEFFKNIPQIKNKLQTLQDVGLGYIKLGQPAPTLSGGEAQRVKLSRELSKKSTGKTFYLLDEPTTGLHFADLEKLISCLRRLVRQGNTVAIIEHNIDVIKNADWVVDLGPEGGESGGEVIFSGPILEILKCKKSHTGQALKK